MKFFTLPLITCVCIGSMAFAQTDSTQAITPIRKATQHRMLVQASGLYNLNLPQDMEGFSAVSNFKPALSVNNTFGYQFGFAYEYRNRHNITFSPGVVYGMQRLNYDNKFTFGHLAPGVADMYLEQIRISSHYLGTSFALGYDHQLRQNKNITLQAKLGLSTIFPLKPFSSGQRLWLSYRKEGNDTTFMTQIAFIEMNRQRSEVGYPYYSVYLGAAYKVESAFIKDLRFGLNFIHAFWFFTGDGRMGSFSNQHFDLSTNRVAGEGYLDRFRNIGVTVGVGF